MPVVTACCLIEHAVGCVAVLGRVPVDDLPDVHCVVAGPSCAPLSRNGTKVQFNDSRALSFSACVRAIEHMASRQCSIF